MNKIEKLIKSLESNYNVDVERVLELYEQKESLKDIAKDQSTTLYVIRTVLQHLQLKRPKSKRESCMIEFKAQRQDKGVDTFVDELEESIKYLTDQLNNSKRALDVARQENNVLRADRRNDARADSTFSQMLELFEKAYLAKDMEELKVTVQAAPKYQESSDGLLVVLSDQHIGEDIGDNVPQNSYNYDVAEKRFDVILDSILMFPLQSTRIKVGQCGDMLKGIIHGGIYTSEDSFVDSLIKAVDLHVKFYSVLAATYENVDIHSITGNHDRITDNPALHDKHLDFTKLVDEMVIRQLKAQGIKNVNLITTDVPYQMVNINGAETVLFHGDTLRKYQPYLENQRALLQDICVGMFKKPYKHAISGHGHTFCATHNQYGGMSIMNGSIPGSSEYGINSGFRDITASQTICFVNKNGDIEDIKAINLNDVR